MLSQWRNPAISGEIQAATGLKRLFLQSSFQRFGGKVDFLCQTINTKIFKPHLSTPLKKEAHYDASTSVEAMQKINMIATDSRRALRVSVFGILVIKKTV
jgi:hypothetical protein